MPLLEVRNLSLRYTARSERGPLHRRRVGRPGRPNGAGKRPAARHLRLVRFEERMKRGTTGDIVLEGELHFRRPAHR